MDENSQSSIMSAGGPETMNHDSMDHFANDNSMDGSNSTPMELMMHKNAIMTGPFQPNMSSNSLMEMATDLRVKQEEEQQIAVQMVKDLVKEKCDLIFSNQNVSTAPTTTDQLQQTIEQATAFTSAHQGLMTEAGTANNLNHILSFPNGVSAMSSTMMNTSPTSNSPLSQDVMLNSQPAAAMNSSPNGNTSSITSITPIVTTQSESDIIMNPTISPTMMCNPAGDANTLMPNSVAIGDTPMMTASIPTTQQTTTSDAILNNLIQPMSIKQSASEVKNMILNAAADILSSEPNSITTETTMNALISLSQEQSSSPTQPQSTSPPNLISMHEGQSIMPQHFDNPATQSITNILTRSDSSSSVVVLAGNNQLIQNVVAAAAAQNASEIIQNQIVPADTMLNHIIPNHINSQIITTPSTIASMNQNQQNLIDSLQWVFDTANVERRY